MLRLVDHSAELIEKLDGVVQGDEELSGEYTRVDSRSVKHEDILQLVKFVRKHNKHLQRNDFDTRPYNLVTLLAGSKAVDDNTAHSFKSKQYDATMKEIKDQVDRNAYLNMVGSSLFPQDERTRKPKSVYKEIKDELQVITSIMASMIAVSTAIWWAGGTMNPTYKTLFALSGAIGIAIVEASLYIIIQTRKGGANEEKKMN